jgi:hypothetical protein
MHILSNSKASIIITSSHYLVTVGLVCILACIRSQSVSQSVNRLVVFVTMMASGTEKNGMPEVDEEKQEEFEESAPSATANTTATATKNGHGNGNGNGNHARQIKRPSMLPEVTPELIREHVAQQQLMAAKNGISQRNGSSRAPSDTSGDKGSYLAFICPCHNHDEDAHGEPAAICGVPYYLFMILTALVAAVAAGTILAVIYYDPHSGVQPPEYPSPAPTPIIMDSPTTT